MNFHAQADVMILGGCRKNNVERFSVFFSFLDLMITAALAKAALMLLIPPVGIATPENDACALHMQCNAYRKTLVAVIKSV